MKDELNISKRKRRKIKRMQRIEKQVEKLENIKLKKNCVYGLNLIQPPKREKQLVSPPRRVVVNRSPEEWNAFMQQARI
ncbi:MAG: hypothetical protein ABSA44_03650 [Bacteroidota bacterium]